MFKQNSAKYKVCSNNSTISSAIVSWYKRIGERKALIQYFAKQYLHDSTLQWSLLEMFLLYINIWNVQWAVNRQMPYIELSWETKMLLPVYS